MTRAPPLPTRRHRHEPALFWHLVEDVGAHLPRDPPGIGSHGGEGGGSRDGGSRIVTGKVERLRNEDVVVLGRTVV